MQLLTDTQTRELISQIQHVGSIEKHGLFDGSLGIAMFLFEESQKQYYDDEFSLAEKYLEDAVDNINLDFDFEDGFVGVGYGVQYLINHKCITPDSEEIFEEIDEKLREILWNIGFTFKTFVDAGQYLALRYKSTDFNTKNIKRRLKHSLLLNLDMLNFLIVRKQAMDQFPYLIKEISTSFNPYAILPKIIYTLAQYLYLNLFQARANRLLHLFMTKLLDEVDKIYPENLSYLKILLDDLCNHEIEIKQDLLVKLKAHVLREPMYTFPDLYTDGSAIYLMTEDKNFIPLFLHDLLISKA